MTLLPTHQGIALQDHTPALGGGVQPFFLLSLLWSRPPSLFLVAKRLGAQSLSLLLLLLLFPLLQLLCCFLSCPTNSQPLINEIVEAARLLPAPFLPLLSSPLQRHCGFSNVLPLSPGRRGVLFWGGAWGRGGGTAPFTLSWCPWEVSTLAGFPPLNFGLTDLYFVLVDPSSVDNGGGCDSNFWWVSACMCVCV